MKLSDLFRGLILVGVVSSLGALGSCRPSKCPEPSQLDASVVIIEPSDAGEDAGDAGEVTDEQITDASTPCTRACATLTRYACEERKPVAGETCPQLCERAKASGHPMPTTCLLNARSKAAVKACGVLCDPPSR